MAKWQYKTLSFTMNADADTVDVRLNGFGLVGWELVAVRPVTTSVGSQWDWIAIMKRPLVRRRPDSEA